MLRCARDLEALIRGRCQDGPRHSGRGQGSQGGGGLDRHLPIRPPKERMYLLSNLYLKQYQSPTNPKNTNQALLKVFPEEWNGDTAINMYKHVNIIYIILL